MHHGSIRQSSLVSNDVTQSAPAASRATSVEPGTGMVRRISLDSRSISITPPPLTVSHARPSTKVTEPAFGYGKVATIRPVGQVHAGHVRLSVEPDRLALGAHQIPAAEPEVSHGLRRRIDLRQPSRIASEEPTLSKGQPPVARGGDLGDELVIRGETETGIDIGNVGEINPEDQAAVARGHPEALECEDRGAAWLLIADLGHDDVRVRVDASQPAPVALVRYPERVVGDGEPGRTFAGRDAGELLEGRGIETADVVRENVRRPDRPERLDNVDRSGIGAKAQGLAIRAIKGCRPRRWERGERR